MLDFHFGLDHILLLVIQLLYNPLVLLLALLQPPVLTLHLMEVLLMLHGLLLIPP